MSPNCAFSPHWAGTALTASFSRAILDNGSFKRRFLGRRWVSMFGADPRRLKSTIERHIRFGIRRICLLGAETADVDGNVEDRRGTISAFNGEPPTIHRCESEQDEAEIVGVWLQERRDEGVEAVEIGVFVRSTTELERACAAVRGAGLTYRVLDDGSTTGDDPVSVSTMHLAKGLEFRAVAVMACDDEVIPLQERIETIADDADLEEVYNTERHLLYVACTRARDHLLITVLSRRRSSWMTWRCRRSPQL